MRVTVKQLAKQLNVGHAHANGFIQTLVAIEKAKAVGKVDKKPGTKGKAATIFEIEDRLINK